MTKILFSLLSLMVNYKTARRCHERLQKFYRGDGRFCVLNKQLPIEQIIEGQRGLLSQYWSRMMYINDNTVQFPFHHESRSQQAR
mmetsp:Transcript_42998/g.49411  ORF Transcript_42998/g.49411 Transcript_42998/m.49411 type:complete len:85 (-) Transcript_42998:292-546(-)